LAILYSFWPKFKQPLILPQRYTQTSEKYQACLDIFQSECRLFSPFTAKIRTNEREISSLLGYFSKRVQAIFAVYRKDTQIKARYLQETV